MTKPSNDIKSVEKVISEICTFYEKYGYSQYKMSKFEEYDLYVKNKDFLISDNIITFTDTNGKLMALKPDVTLSIIKNTKDTKGYVQKVYYNENVYRVTKSTNAYKEIMQIGLECIGDIDTYSIYEALNLACESLNIISPDFVLDISNIKIISDVISLLNLPLDKEKQIIKCIEEKNIHQIMQITKDSGCDKQISQKLIDILSLKGNAKEEIEKLKDICDNISKDAIDELEVIVNALCEGKFKDKIKIDFSVINDMGYYNSIVFRGFVNTIPVSILSGGQYDKLMEKMHRKSKAIGFAIYPDNLERLYDDYASFDVDTIILYDDTVSIKDLNNAINMFISSGQSVMAQKNIPSKIKYQKLVKLHERGLEIIETNA